MYLYYFFAAIVIWLGIVSLRGGIRFAQYVRRETARALPDFTPFASILAPFRGLDQGLRENIAALFDQDYPAYELIFVTDRVDDPAIAVIEDLEHSVRDAPHLSSAGKRIAARTIIAGPATDSGQKVHNLRVAVREIDSRTEVLVFVDTDARPHSRWLRSIVEPLQDERIGAATGYRWFVPVGGGFASHLRSVWNASIASALGASEEKNFCWGGSTAIRRETFERLSIRKRWQGTVSDDFTLTRALQEEKLPIHFVPACLTASLEDCTLRELFEFTTRQLKITRAYASHLWKAALIGSLLFSLVFFGGLVLVSIRAILELTFVIPLALLCLIFVLGAAKAYIRLSAVSIPLASYRSQLRRGLLAQVFLWPIASALFLYNSLAAAASSRISWRGITYELKSPTEAVIIRGTDFSL
ncbi:MAG: glycosyltransferase [Pyrinomonadaceae bacterium]